MNTYWWAVERARNYMTDAVRYDDASDFGHACGIATGLYFADAIDGAEFNGLRNEFRFEFFRAKERRMEGLPV